MSADWPEGVGRRVLAAVGSTMDEAAARAPGLTAPEWILALEQTAARGRRGRAWSNPAGNFAATLVIPDPGPPAVAAQRSFVAALALGDTFVAVTGRAEAFALKWPNDVLLNGGKVAGILLESLTPALAIGFGVNLASAPAAAEVEAGAVRPVALAETGAVIGPEEFLDHLAPAFHIWETRFRTQGFAPIREAWLARAARLGEVITARMGARVETGTFETVDADGQLVLGTPKGRLHLPAAEIAF